MRSSKSIVADTTPNVRCWLDSYSGPVGILVAPLVSLLSRLSMQLSPKHEASHRTAKTKLAMEIAMQYATAIGLQSYGVKVMFVMMQVPCLLCIGLDVVKHSVHGDQINNLSVSSTRRREHAPHQGFCRLKGAHRW